MPYFGALTDTLLIDGTDLQSIAGIVVTDLSGLMAPGRRRGDNVTIPGRRGVIAVPKVYEAYEFSVGITVLADDATGATPATVQARRVQMLANLQAVANVLDGAAGDGLLTLTRRISNGVSYVSHTCSAEFVDGLQVDLLNAETGQTELQFINHDGAWLNGVTPVVP